MAQAIRNGADKESKVFINKKYYDHDFSNRDLTHADFRGCTLVNCHFDNSDLSYATFEGANCYGSTFRQSRMYHTSLKDAVMAECDVDPRDMFGLTLSVSCDTFDKIKLGKIWLASWLFLPLLADIPEATRGRLLEILNELIGEERVKSMERHFINREM
jgi:hypothetical protein